MKKNIIRAKRLRCKIKDGQQLYQLPQLSHVRALTTVFGRRDIWLAAVDIQGVVDIHGVAYLYGRKHIGKLLGKAAKLAAFLLIGLAGPDGQSEFDTRRPRMQSGDSLRADQSVVLGHERITVTAVGEAYRRQPAQGCG